MPSACEQRTDNATTRSPNSPEMIETLKAEEEARLRRNEEIQIANFRAEKVSRYEIDDTRFALTGMAIGKKTYLTSQTPILTYKVPKDADYVEIIRCKANANIRAGSETMSLETMVLSGLGAEAKKEKLIHSAFFDSARVTEGCVLVNQGTIAGEFADPYCPTGEYRYLAQACIAPQRLIDTEKLTSRNCSRQVGISDVMSYTNSRRDQELKAIHKSAIALSKVDSNVQSARALAEDYIRELDSCTEREHRRAVSLKTKTAWLQLVASAIDIYLEIYMYKANRPATNRTPIWEHYLKPNTLGRAVDTFGLLSALGGFSFGMIFPDLFSHQSDMPRSCARLEAIKGEMEKLTVEWGGNTFDTMFWDDVAALAAQGVDVMDGSVPMPPEGL